MKVTEFKSQEQEYFNWLAANPRGFVLNVRSGSAAYTALHTARCVSISEQKASAAPDGFTGRAYIKICSNDHELLRDWASREGVANYDTCSKCNPLGGDAGTAVTSFKLQSALVFGRAAYLGEMTQAEGTRRLREQTGLSPGSARFLVGIYGAMRDGRAFAWKLSAVDLEFFLDAFSQEGVEWLGKALRAVELHLASRGKTPALTSALLEKYRRRLQLESGHAVHLSDIERAFQDEVSARASEHEKRRRRLQSARRLPSRVEKLVYVYERNPDVVAEVLWLARGICQGCGNAAPFKRRSDRSPYLEVHHIVPLASGGEDSVENAIALCPNCHRQRHYGEVMES